MPDERVVCSHLHHVGVALAPRERPVLRKAQCDTGRDEVSRNASMCRPGGHPCWAREVEFATAEPKAVSPLALHESLDYLDALWRNALGSHLLRLRAAAVPGKLATSCESAAEFEVKLSALADIISTFDVSDGLLDPAHRDDANYGKGRTLARLESSLVYRVQQAGAGEEVVGQAKEAVKVLRNAMDLRRGFQHTGSGAAGKLPAAFRTFGLAYPLQSPTVAWARVQSDVLRALESLRQVLRGLE